MNIVTELSKMGKVPALFNDYQGLCVDKKAVFVCFKAIFWE